MTLIRKLSGGVYIECDECAAYAGVYATFDDVEEAVKGWTARYTSPVHVVAQHTTFPTFSAEHLCPDCGPKDPFA